MSQYAILTAIGADRPGLVDEATHFIYERGGNIEESRMVNLRGQFAIMLLFRGETDALQRVRQDLPLLNRQTKLQAELHPAAARALPTAQHRAFKMTVSTMDQPGLVHRIAHLLRERSVNIESLDSHIAAAPVSGAPVFEMAMVLSIPAEVSLTDLRQRLDALCGELNIDWELTAM